MTVHYRAMRDPSTGGMLYLVGGVGYASMKEMRKAFPKGTAFQRIAAKRSNRLFG